RSPTSYERVPPAIRSHACGAVGRRRAPLLRPAVGAARGVLAQKAVVATFVRGGERILGHPQHEHVAVCIDGNIGSAIVTGAAELIRPNGPTFDVVSDDVRVLSAEVGRTDV